MISHFTLPRSFSKVYPVAARADGVRIWDIEGREYIDLSGSAAVNFIGFGVEDVADAMAAQAQQITIRPFQPVHQLRSRRSLPARCSEFAGPAFEGGAVFFTCGGSEAVETALKLARQYQVETGHPERYEIISRRTGVPRRHARSVGSKR